MRSAKEREVKEAATVTVPPAPEPPSTIKLLQKERADKIIAACLLDQEIKRLDEDITFLERHPEGDRILKRIAERFKRE